MTAANCVRCGKPAGNHRASDLACPVGRKHRAVGYTEYSDHCRLTLPPSASPTPKGQDA